VETSRFGDYSGKGSQGASFYMAPNPSFGATFTYYLKEKLTTRKEKRQEAEKKALKSKKPPKYPTIDERRAEDEEREPQVFLVVTDAENEVVRRIPCSRDKGVHRASWDLRYPSYRPVQLRSGEELPPWLRDPAGPMALPGTYTASLFKEVDGVVSQIGESQKFEVVPLDLGTFPAEDRVDVLAFQRESGRLQRAVLGAARTADETQAKLAHIRKAIIETPGIDPAMLAEVDALQKRINAIQCKLNGDRTLARLEEPVPPSINERLGAAIEWYVTCSPTQTQREAYKYAGDEFKTVLADIRTLVEKDLKQLEEKLEQAGAPWTPGRIPTWDAE
jgi:hypothetical protein